jgi:hypothetical protein
VKIEINEGAAFLGTALAVCIVLAIVAQSCSSIARECVKSGGEWRQDQCFRRDK